MSVAPPSKKRQSIPLLAAELATVGLFFLVATVFHTWPLAALFTTHVPSDGGDAPYFVWNLWWVHRALVDLHVSPLWTDYVLYPQTVSLALHTLTLFNGLLALPLLAVTSPLIASNVLFIASFVLPGVGAYALARNEGAGRPGALVAGYVFAFSPYVLAHALGHFNLTTTWPLPWYALCLLRTLEGRSFGWPLAAGVLLAVLNLNEYQYHAFALLFTILVLCCWLLVHRGDLRLRQLFLRLAVMGAAWFALTWPLIYAVWRQVTTGLDPTDRTDISSYFSADLTAFFIRSPLSWGGPEGFAFASRDFAGVGTADTTVYLGLTAFALAIIGAFGSKRRDSMAEPGVVRVRLWLACMLAFVLLSLGPELHIQGASIFTVAGWSFSVPLPYELLANVPYLGTARVPARLTIIATMALAVLTSFGFDAIVRRFAQFSTDGQLRRFSLALLIPVLALITAEVAVVPMRLDALAVSPFYQQLAADGDDYAVLELPFGVAAGPSINLGDKEPLLQYYQAVHEKRLLNGFVARERPEKPLHFTGVPGVRWLLHPLPGGQAIEDLDPAVVKGVFRDLDIRYAIIHPRLFADQATKSEIQGYLEEVLDAEEVYRDEALIAYRIGGGARLQAANQRVRLASPARDERVRDLRPTLQWGFEDAGWDVAEVQLSVDRDFGQLTSRYWETRDARRSAAPHTYPVPEAYPLRPGQGYYWRVRPVVNGAPGEWSEVRRFRTPHDQ